MTPYSLEVLDLPTGFSFPLQAVLLAMQAIEQPSLKLCPFCEGQGHVFKNKNPIFCRACDGTGKKGGYGRKEPKLPLALFTPSNASLEAFGRF